MILSKRSLIILFTFFVGAIHLFAGDCFGGKDDTKDLTSLLMERATAKDIEGLLELRDQAVLSKKNRFAYHLARFIADPKGYSETFIAVFPSNDVMGYVYELELAQTKDGQQVTPYFLYSLDQLGRLAIDGNSDAVKKLFDTMIHSDGVVTEYLCERISKVIESKMGIALDSLSKLSTIQKKRIYICFGDSASADEISNVKSSLEKKLSENHINIKREILEAIDNTY